MTRAQRLLHTLRSIAESVRLVEDGAGGAGGGGGATGGAPANAAGYGNIAGIGVGPKGEPGIPLPRKKRWEKNDTFANADVFDVELEDVMKLPGPKLPHERFAKYVGTDPEQGEALRQHARKNWKRDIVLRDNKTGVMTFLRRRKPNGR